jgi:CheY-like chemotaxis protein
MNKPPRYLLSLYVSGFDETTRRQIQELRNVLGECFKGESWELSMTKQILVIDDEASVRDAFNLALTSAGFAVECAADGLSGVEAASRYRPDMVFIDMKMPDMDGLETLRRLTACYESPPPVCMITSYLREFVEPLQQARAEKLDFQVAAKPLSTEQIRRIAQATVGVQA